MRLLSLSVVLVCLSGTAAGQAPEKLVASDSRQMQMFGNSVDFQINWAVVGAWFDNSMTGAAYVYYWDGFAPWVDWTKLNASDAGTGDGFGTSTAVNGTWIAVGAPYEDERSYNAGAVYMYRLDGATWIEVQKVLPPEGVGGAIEFGTDVDLRDDAMVVGARSDFEQGVHAGAAYVYRNVGGTWQLEAKLLASDGAADATFGQAVAIEADRIAVGAPFANRQGDGSGAAYVYVKSGTRWTEEAQLLAADGQAGDQFGQSIDMDGDRIVVGAPKGTGMEAGSGAAFVFGRTGTTWNEKAKVWASDGAVNDDYAWSVAIGGSAVAVGAPGRTVNDQWAAGAVYLYDQEGSDGPESKKVTSPAVGSQERYGESISANRYGLLVGASGNSDIANLGGAAYKYSGSVFNVAVEDAGVVADYRLDQNYPNPFNPATTIRYALPRASRVHLAVFDILGREVRSLDTGAKPAGTHEVSFDASGLPSGVYVYRLRAGDYVETRSLAVLK